jgi:RNA polymerase sigma factor (sigma-70 family)
MGFLCSYQDRSLADLIAEAQATGDGPALREILQRFEPLTKSLGSRLANGRSYREDVENASRCVLVRAVHRHRGAVEAFPGYAKHYMRGGALRELKAWSPKRNWSICGMDAIGPEELPKALGACDEPDHSGFGDGFLAALVRGLRPKEQELLHLRYVQDLSLADIAAQSVTSISAVSQRLATAHRDIAKQVAA